MEWPRSELLPYQIGKMHTNSTIKNNRTGYTKKQKAGSLWWTVKNTAFMYSRSINSKPATRLLLEYALLLSCKYSWLTSLRLKAKRRVFSTLKDRSVRRNLFFFIKAIDFEPHSKAGLIARVWFESCIVWAGVECFSPNGSAVVAPATSPLILALGPSGLPLWETSPSRCSFSPGLTRIKISS